MTAYIYMFRYAEASRSLDFRESSLLPFRHSRDSRLNGNFRMEDVELSLLK